MNKRFTKMFVIGLVVCASYAQAAIKMSGHMEGGLLWQNIKAGGGATAGSDIGFMVDHVGLKTEADVSNKTSVVITKEFAFNYGGSPVAVASGAIENSSFYFNKLGALGAGRFMFNVDEAYIAHKCSESVKIKAGMFATPYSMEGMWNRWASPSYMYSNGYNMAVANGWNYDVGVGVEIGAPIPGLLEIAVLDGQVASTAGDGAADTPAIAARWHGNFDAGSISIEPAISTYIGRLEGGSEPNDIGLSGGAKVTAGPFAIAAEFIRSTSAGTLGGAKTHARSIWVEPSFDAGVAMLSAKLDLARVGANDINLGFAVSKQYDDWRARVTYTIANLSGNLGGVSHDVRVLMGTTF